LGAWVYPGYNADKVEAKVTTGIRGKSVLPHSPTQLLDRYFSKATSVERAALLEKIQNPDNGFVWRNNTQALTPAGRQLGSVVNGLRKTSASDRAALRTLGTPDAKFTTSQQALDVVLQWHKAGLTIDDSTLATLKEIGYLNLGLKSKKGSNFITVEELAKTPNVVSTKSLIDAVEGWNEAMAVSKSLKGVKKANKKLNKEAGKRDVSEIIRLMADNRLIQVGQNLANMLSKQLVTPIDIIRNNQTIPELSAYQPFIDAIARLQQKQARLNQTQGNGSWLSKMITGAQYTRAINNLTKQYSSVSLARIMELTEGTKSKFYAFSVPFGIQLDKAKQQKQFNDTASAVISSGLDKKITIQQIESSIKSTDTLEPITLLWKHSNGETFKGINQVLDKSKAVQENLGKLVENATLENYDDVKGQIKDKSTYADLSGLPLSKTTQDRLAENANNELKAKKKALKAAAKIAQDVVAAKVKDEQGEAPAVAVETPEVKSEQPAEAAEVKPAQETAQEIEVKGQKFNIVGDVTPEEINSLKAAVINGGLNGVNTIKIISGPENDVLYNRSNDTLYLNRMVLDSKYSGLLAWAAIHDNGINNSAEVRKAVTDALGGSRKAISRLESLLAKESGLAKVEMVFVAAAIGVAGAALPVYKAGGIKGLVAYAAVIGLTGLGGFLLKKRLHSSKKTSSQEPSDKGTSPVTGPVGQTNAPGGVNSKSVGSVVAGLSDQAALGGTSPALANNNDKGMSISNIRLKAIGVLTSFTSGLAPPVAFAKNLLSRLIGALKSRGKVGALVVKVLSSIVNAVRSAVRPVEKLTNAQSATSVSGEKGQDVVGTSSNIGNTPVEGVSNVDSRVMPGNSIGNKIARIINRIRGSISASAKEVKKVGVKVLAVRLVKFVTGSIAAAAQHRAAVAKDGTVDETKTVETQGSESASGIRKAFIKVLHKLIVIPDKHKDGKDVKVVVPALENHFKGPRSEMTLIGNLIAKIFNQFAHTAKGEKNNFGNILAGIFGGNENTQEIEDSPVTMLGKTGLRKLFVTHFPEAVQVMDVLIDGYLSIEIKKLKEQGVNNPEEVAVENIARRLEERGNALLDLVNDPDLREYVKKEIDERIKAGRTDVSLYELLLLWNDGIDAFKEALEEKGQDQRADFYRNQVFYKVNDKEDLASLYNKGLRSLRFVRLLEAGDLTGKDHLTLATHLYIDNGEYRIWGIYTGFRGEAKYLNMSLNEFYATSRQLFVAMNVDDENARDIFKSELSKTELKKIIVLNASLPSEKIESAAIEQLRKEMKAIRATAIEAKTKAVSAETKAVSAETKAVSAETKAVSAETKADEAKDKAKQAVGINEKNFKFMNGENCFTTIAPMPIRNALEDERKRIESIGGMWTLRVALQTYNRLIDEYNANH
ncbi:MAG: hypothetical protein M0R17_13805, partial [Candidatus Omnitrophica bacterium]|nr:hypothetical protein [Candidatus Omnitrophota bacterium]